MGPCSQSAHARIRAARLSSLILWGNELGIDHYDYSVPTLLAGGAGGAVRTGRYIDYIDWRRPIVRVEQDGPMIEGVPYNRLLVSILQAMGLTPADYVRDGQPGYGSYAQYGKDARSFAVDYDASQHGLPLPGLHAS